LQFHLLFYRFNFQIYFFIPRYNTSQGFQNLTLAFKLWQGLKPSRKVHLGVMHSTATQSEETKWEARWWLPQHSSKGVTGPSSHHKTLQIIC
jgi:hypothetical protein